MKITKVILSYLVLLLAITAVTACSRAKVAPTSKIDMLSDVSGIDFPVGSVVEDLVIDNFSSIDPTYGAKVSLPLHAEEDFLAYLNSSDDFVAYHDKSDPYYRRLFTPSTNLYSWWPTCTNTLEFSLQPTLESSSTVLILEVGDDACTIYMETATF